VSSLKVGLIEAAKRVSSTVGVSFFPELFDQTRLEITIMSVPKALECSPKERPENIVIGREGLIIKDCGIIVYFLPWVAVEKNLSPEDFLDEACKLGVGRPKMWMEHSTEAMTFQVQTITG
jgi:AMMECR1 domain-containing protein